MIMEFLREQINAASAMIDRSSFDKLPRTILKVILLTSTKRAANQPTGMTPEDKFLAVFSDEQNLNETFNPV